MSQQHPSWQELICYLTGDTSGLTKFTPERLEGHIKKCAACKETAEFIKAIQSGAKELTEEEFNTDQPCPESLELATYARGQANALVAQAIRAHIVRCDDCFDEYLTIKGKSETLWDTMTEIFLDESEASNRKPRKHMRSAARVRSKQT